MANNEVYFFSTCVVNTFASQAGIGAVKLLEKLGVTVHVPLKQTCCGQPAYNAGYPSEARNVARQQLALFPKKIPIVLPSGSCAAMMKKHFKDLFAVKDPKDHEAIALAHHAADVAQRIVEWNDYMLAYLEKLPENTLNDNPKPINVVFHASCHSLREMGTSDQALKLLARLKNVHVFQLAHKNECCGFGGMFALRYPSISTAMADRKLDELRFVKQKHAVERLLSNDFSCLLHLGGRLQREKIQLPVQHIAEFIAQRVL